MDGKSITSRLCRGTMRLSAPACLPICDVAEEVSVRCPAQPVVRTEPQPPEHSAHLFGRRSVFGEGGGEGRGGVTYNLPDIEEEKRDKDEVDF